MNNIFMTKMFLNTSCSSNTSITVSNTIKTKMIIIAMVMLWRGGFLSRSMLKFWAPV